MDEELCMERLGGTQWRFRPSPTWSKGVILSPLEVWNPIDWPWLIYATIASNHAEVSWLSVMQMTHNYI